MKYLMSRIPWTLTHFKLRNAKVYITFSTEVSDGRWANWPRLIALMIGTHWSNAINLSFQSVFVLKLYKSLTKLVEVIKS